ncbi:uroporphyrinogen decarboxylase/cobalamine-independent methonine synthase family protein [Mycolicibacterium hassiacum]|uniref:methionine synthase n=1 Tax=Mycolicibacterium hassiacum TaxID=46351 RepID=UPI0002E10BA5|nr:methionine synthase [Mycolicibacterium hassiacum]MBX5487038.1 methionine synthase [Mycolicibacterium hassiacum]
MSVLAVATGIGSWPGTSPRQAAEIVVGELHHLPHLVELPARGVGADIIGRTGAMLVDIGFDTVPRGYRVASGRTAVARRARSMLDEDIDALEEAWERAGLRGSDRRVKVQAAGPITLAAQLELPRGHRAITDHGAVRDLAASLAEGVAAHRAEIARRLDTTVVVQFDEPVLPAALAGRLTGVTSLTRVHPVDEAVAIGLIDDCVAAVDAPVILHCCASDLPWKTLLRTAVHALSVDVSTLADRDHDGLGEFVDSGRTVLLGLVPAEPPPARPSFEQTAHAAAELVDRLGFPRSVLAERVGITPACGLAAAPPQWARTAIELAERAVDAVREDPEAV